MPSNYELIIIGLVVFSFIIWNLSISMRIVEELKKRDIKARIAHRRGAIFKYLKMYKEVTINETGKAGSLYYKFLWTFFAYMLLLLIGITTSYFLR